MTDRYHYIKHLNISFISSSSFRVLQECHRCRTEENGRLKTSVQRELHVQIDQIHNRHGHAEG